MLTEEQARQIKQQIIQQIETNFPEDKKQSAKQQVELMNNEQLEEFLKQNNLIKEGQKPENLANPESVFRMIVEGKIPAHKIDENKDAVAVLEINPVSKGHMLIIPKKIINSVEQMPQNAFSLAKKISKKIKSKLKPKDVNISSSNAFGEFIINVFPVYENESLNSQRKKADEKELLELQKKLGKKTVKKVVTKKSPEKISEKLWMPKRIP